MAEIVAKDYARKIGADIPIFSSGVLVESMNLSPKTSDLARSVGLEGTTLRETIEKLLEREIELRNKALASRGYDTLASYVRRQTSQNNSVDLMLAATNGVKARLLDLRSVPSKAYTIAEYANVELPSPALRAWFTDINAWESYLDSLIKAVPKAIDRYLCEFNV